MRIAIFPARSGSVRIPGKNFRDFRGKPMIQWPIEAARATGLFDHIIVSTDDVKAVAHLDCLKDCLAHERKPDDGTKGTQEVAREVLASFKVANDLCCVIYPCSPLLRPCDLLYGFTELQRPGGAYYAISVYPGEPIMDAGCFYWGHANTFRSSVPLAGTRTTLVPLPSDRCIDINTPEDWARAEQMFDALQEPR